MIESRSFQQVYKKIKIDSLLVHRLLLGLVLFLGAALRLYDLGTESFWIDEQVMIEVAYRSPSEIITSAQLGAGRPPLYVLLAHVWVQLFGTSEVATRSLSALAGIASLPLLYVLGRALFGRQVALISTFLMVLSEFQIYHSQNFRYYSLFVLITLASYLFFVRALKGGRPRDFLLLSLSNLLLFFTHTFAVFLIAAQGLYFLLRWRRYRERGRPWLLSQFFLALVLAPGVLLSTLKATSGTAGPQSWILRPPLWAPLETLWKFLFPARELPPAGAFALALVLLGLGIVVAAQAVGVERWRGEVRQLPAALRAFLKAKQDELLLVGTWLVVPITLPFLLSWLISPLYVDRYTIGAAPALYLGAGATILFLRRVVPPVATLGLLVVLIVPGLTDYYTSYIKEQWRESAAYVAQHEQPQDVILFTPGERGALRDSFYWYYRGDQSSCEINLSQVEQAEALFHQCTRQANAGRVWLVMRGQPDRVAPFEALFLEHPPAGVTISSAHHYTDISLYLLELSPTGGSRSGERDES